jgi:hypothetical protein
MSNGQVKLPSGDELPARVLKRIGALGHHLAQWAEALETLRGRLEKDRLPEAWRGHVRAGLPSGGGILEKLEVSVRVPEEDAAGWVVEPGREEAVPALTAGARALLHLPALRKTWAGWLRESVFEDLKLRMRRAWVVDPALLPSHGALPGLGIARWGDFDRLAETGRSFRVLPKPGEVWMVDAKSSGVDWKSAADRLTGCAVGEAVIEELGVHNGTLWRAVFGVSEGRWEMNTLER